MKVRQVAHEASSDDLHQLVEQQRDMLLAQQILIEQQAERLAAQDARLATLEAASTSTQSAGTASRAGRRNRARGMSRATLLKSAAVGALGIAGAGSLNEQSAAAANGSPVLLGSQTNTAESPTTVTYDGPSPLSGVMFLANDSVYASGASAYSAALGGWAGVGGSQGAAQVANGVYGYTQTPTGYGVVGAGTGAAGVYGHSSSGPGILGDNTTAPGIGVKGTDSATNLPSGVSAGVWGESVHNIGVHGLSTDSHGVSGTTSNASASGVTGNNSAATGVGVSGYGYNGVFGSNTGGDATSAGVAGFTNTAGTNGMFGHDASGGAGGIAIFATSNNGVGARLFGGRVPLVLLAGTGTTPPPGFDYGEHWTDNTGALHIYTSTGWQKVAFTGGPTDARVARFAASRRGGTLQLAWTMADGGRGVRGFNVYAGSRRLNAHPLATHRSRAYRYRTGYTGPGPFRLGVILANGHELFIHPG